MMEVMHGRVEEEVAVEQPGKWRPENGDITSSSSDEDNEIDSKPSNDEYRNQEEKEKNEISENSVYFDKNEGIWKCHHCIWTYKNGNPWIHHHVHQKSLNYGSGGTTLQLSFSGKNLEDVDIPKLVNAVRNNQTIADVKDNIESALNASTSNPTLTDEINVATRGGARENARIDEEEDSDDEEIELEFERAVEKVHTHMYTPYCPNCRSQITKVILRRKKHRPRPIAYKPVDLLGCLSCFSIFTLSGNCLNPFRIFGSGETCGNTQVVAKEPGSAAGGSTAAVGSTNVKQEGGGFNLFGMFRKKRRDHKAPSSQGITRNDEESSMDNSGGALPVSSLHDPLLKGHLSPDRKDEPTGSTGNGGSQKPNDTDTSRPHDPSVPRDDLAINIGDGVGTGQRQGISDERSSKSLEILKCIVHGGLMESIASLSVISSAAASDATTLNIIALGVASVISGLFIFGNNLMDLKNENANQETDKYQELLGTRGHFLLHATFAILSFLVFGIIPPVVYGFTFRESHNKDYKILAVAAASFACVFILAVGKAYVRRLQKFSEYIKTILYYITMAISVSGVAYAAGDLIKMLMDRLGWFEPNQTVPSFIPDAISATPTWASY